VTDGLARSPQARPSAACLRSWSAWFTCYIGYIIAGFVSRRSARCTITSAPRASSPPAAPPKAFSMAAARCTLPLPALCLPLEVAASNWRGVVRRLPGVEFRHRPSCLAGGRQAQAAAADRGAGRRRRGLFLQPGRKATKECGHWRRADFGRVGGSVGQQGGGVPQMPGTSGGRQPRTPPSRASGCSLGQHHGPCWPLTPFTLVLIFLWPSFYTGARCRTRLGLWLNSPYEF